MKRNTFEWSLKPLIVCMRVVLGCTLNFRKPANIADRFAFPILGLFYVIANLVINGPCGLFSENKKLHFLQNLYNDSPLGPNVTSYDFFCIVNDIKKFTLFLSTPLIHLIFMVKIQLMKNGRDLRKILQKIQRQMKLDDVFHCKLRRHCLVALGLLILVNRILFNFFS